MTPDNFLFLFILGVLSVTAIIIYKNDTTPEERDEMLKDEDMWP
jgi:hypothetical protein